MDDMDDMDDMDMDDTTWTTRHGGRTDGPDGRTDTTGATADGAAVCRQQHRSVHNFTTLNRVQRAALQ
eukprot:7311360-Prymnesium_polylepis.1